MKIVIHCDYISLTETIVEKEEKTTYFLFFFSPKARRAKANNVKAALGSTRGKRRKVRSTTD